MRERERGLGWVGNGVVERQRKMIDELNILFLVLAMESSVPWQIYVTLVLAVAMPWQKPTQ